MGQNIGVGGSAKTCQQRENAKSPKSVLTSHGLKIILRNDTTDLDRRPYELQRKREDLLAASSLSSISPSKTLPRVYRQRAAPRTGAASITTHAGVRHARGPQKPRPPQLRSVDHRKTDVIAPNRNIRENPEKRSGHRRRAPLGPTCLVRIVATAACISRRTRACSISNTRRLHTTV
jgi:hypothetical protein